MDDKKERPQVRKHYAINIKDTSISVTEIFRVDFKQEKKPDNAV